MKQETMYIKNNYDGKDEAVLLGVNTYVMNGQIAILLYTPDGEYYADLSVFIEAFDDKNYMAVDVNNLSHAEEFIKKYNLGEFVDYIHSGFVSYPVYCMNLDELSKWDAKGVDEFLKESIENNKETPTIWDRLK